MTIRVLVVDDSAFARKVVREILSGSHGIEVVGIARDGLDALEKIRLLTPDVITLDLNMPQLDGLGVLMALQGSDRPRVVVVSTASDDSQAVVAALQAGATLAVRKPTTIATDRLYEMAGEVVHAVRRAATARWPVVAPIPRSTTAFPSVVLRTQLVVMGASTGGPQALTRVLTALPASFPVPICLVLHMPVGYTEAFAKRLNDQCALEVVEAADRMPLQPGSVIVGRAGLHVVISMASGQRVVRLETVPLDRPHRPSVDVLFASAAMVVGTGVLGVVLTGMGDDGLLGSEAIVAAGGRVITQSESSCVVYGMPRSVAEAGLSDGQVHLGAIPDAIMNRL